MRWGFRAEGLMVQDIQVRGFGVERLSDFGLRVQRFRVYTV